MNILDSHMHLVDLSRGDLADWPMPNSPLRSNWSADAYRREFDQLHLQGSILVETSRRWENDLWLLQMAQSEPGVLGVVANLQPDLDGFDARLARAMQSPKFVGVRLRPLSEYDLSSTRLKHSLRQLESNARSIEFGAKTPAQKLAFAQLAAEFSDTSFILDHAGHPDSSSSTDSRWREGIKQIAAEPNVFCKVTNALSNRGPKTTLLEALIQTFGRERLVFGSNWPVSSTSSSIGSLVSDFRDALGEDAGFFGENARRAYDIPPN